MADKKPNNAHKADQRSVEFDRFEDLTRKLLKVPKEEADREREKQQREKRVG